jgi:cytoskeleton protein RodZ
MIPLVSSFGEHLRRQREKSGVSLEQIVATTKISRRLLQALEDEQFDLLPGGIFNKSYVKAYAKCVGLNEDEAVAEYLEASQEAPPDTRVIAQQHSSIHSDRRPERSQFPFVPVLVLVVVAAGAVGGWRIYQERKRDREQLMQAPASGPSATSSAIASPARENASQAAQPAAEPKLPTGSGAPPSEITSSSSKSVSPAGATSVPSSQQRLAAGSSSVAPFEVTIRPRNRAWVSIKSDGRYVVRGIIQPPDVKVIRATDEVVFYTGNAGAVEVAFDGKDVPLTGGANEEKVLVFNSHGLLPKVPSQ